MNYVILATDSAPTYSVWAPVAIRLWARLGYKTILYVDRAEEAWRSPFGQAILDECWATVGTYIGVIPQTGQLTIANTMRCSRLVAAACPVVQPEDFILTADVDMMPLSRTFFARTEPFVVLRAMFQVWLSSQVVPPAIDLEQIRPGEFRFPFCYAGATVAIWREMFPEIVPGDPKGSLARLVGDALDAVDLDEILLSRRFLESPRAQGPVQVLNPDGVWQKGELTLVDPLTLPNLSEYFNMPRAMLRLMDQWTPSQGAPPPPEAIDFIPFRFDLGVRPWSCFDVATAYWPEEREWLQRYRARIEALLS